MLVIFPTALQVGNATHPSTPQQVLTERARAADVGAVDLLPIYRDECQLHGPHSCDGFVNWLFADVWMHPNSRGHTLAAEALSPHFR